MDIGGDDVRARAQLTQDCSVRVFSIDCRIFMSYGLNSRHSSAGYLCHRLNSLQFFIRIFMSYELNSLNSSAGYLCYGLNSLKFFSRIFMPWTGNFLGNFPKGWQVGNLLNSVWKFQVFGVLKTAVKPSTKTVSS